jgi:hypothetical protein
MLSRAFTFEVESTPYLHDCIRGQQVAMGYPHSMQMQ